jgi:hypothetical protein
LAMGQIKNSESDNICSGQQGWYVARKVWIFERYCST